MFKQNPNILSFVFPHLMHIIVDQPYVGGKNIENHGASIADFLFQSGITNVVTIEIKTPETKLVENTTYRDMVYPISSELSGLISQVALQRDKLQKEYISLKYNSRHSDTELKVFNPQSILIIGNSNDLKFEQLESFELYRKQLKDIQIITFDELVNKLELIQKYLESNVDGFQQSNNDLPF